MLSVAARFYPGEMATKRARPPNAPWKKLKPKTDAACLAFHYSDPLSPLAVREITRPQDNKSDPNLETGTFGLFSTCERQLRTSVVQNGVPFVIFITNRNGERVINGYFEIGWYAEGVFGSRDYVLAASKMRFVHPNINLGTLPEPAKFEASAKFRTWRHLSPDATKQILSALNRRKDRTPQYLEEIDRLERFNQRVIGFRCWRRAKPFTWTEADHLLKKGSAATAANKSPTDLWRCGNCSNDVRGKSLLKQCPFCGAVGTLEPLSALKQNREG